MQPALSHGREMLRKYCGAQCVFSGKTKRGKKLLNTAHMQQIPPEIQTPVVKLHSSNLTSTKHCSFDSTLRLAEACLHLLYYKTMLQIVNTYARAFSSA